MNSKIVDLHTQSSVFWGVAAVEVTDETIIWLGGETIEEARASMERMEAELPDLPDGLVYAIVLGKRIEKRHKA